MEGQKEHRARRKGGRRERREVRDGQDFSGEREGGKRV